MVSCIFTDMHSHQHNFGTFHHLKKKSPLAVTISSLPHPQPLNPTKPLISLLPCSLCEATVEQCFQDSLEALLFNKDDLKSIL